MAVSPINFTMAPMTGTTVNNVAGTTGTVDTGAGKDLVLGNQLVLSETFVFNGTTYHYQGTARAPNADGFYATTASNGTGTKYFFQPGDTLTSANASVNLRADTLGLGGADYSVTCFYPGTLVATPSGERAVETLEAGDLVLTAEGAAAPVRWLGRQTVSTRFADPLRVLPIRVAAGALGDKLPKRDLLVSPDHALLLDGVLVQASALVNGSTIRRDARVPEVFTYWHVELADHALVLAEGVPAETFVDNVDRMAFDNWAEHEASANPAPMAEMAHPRAKSVRQVPAATRRRLGERAAALPAGAETAA